MANSTDRNTATRRTSLNRFMVSETRRAKSWVSEVTRLTIPPVGCCTGLLTAARLPLDQIELPTPQINPDLVKNLQPSNDRDWSPDQAVLAYAEFLGDRVRVHNIRNCTYDSADDYVVHYYDKTFDLGKLTSVDFIAVPFPDLPGVAHMIESILLAAHADPYERARRTVAMGAPVLQTGR